VHVYQDCRLETNNVTIEVLSKLYSTMSAPGGQHQKDKKTLPMSKNNV